MKTPFALIAYLLLLGNMARAQHPSYTIFLSPTGSDQATGTIDAPLKTLDAVLSKIKAIKGPADITVNFRRGTYQLDKSVLINNLGSPSAHISLTRYNDEPVIISGGVWLNNAGFKPVTDPGVLNRLPDVAKKAVYYYDLSAVKDLDLALPQQHGFGITISPANTEVVYNENIQPIARWPNNTFLTIDQVSGHGLTRANAQNKPDPGATIVSNTDIPAGLRNAGHLFVHGAFSYGWVDDNIPVSGINKNTIHLGASTTYGVFASSDKSDFNLQGAMGMRRYFFFNALEAIDAPGEWYIDGDKKMLYLWPPTGDIKTADITLTSLRYPLWVIVNSRNITISGLTFEDGRGLGLLLENTQNVTISNCTVQNQGTAAISAKDQLQLHNEQVDYAFPLDSFNRNLTIKDCIIRNTGTGGVRLSGGDRRKLLPAGNVIDNCDIYNYSRLNEIYCAGVLLEGVGNRISHCFIHDASGQAILFQGNDHDIYDNHIKSVCNAHYDDVGGIYTGRDPSSTGSTIENNLFEEVGGDFMIAAIYVDDGSGGIHVNNNVFYKCGSHLNTFGSLGAVHINGGSNNQIINNIFWECNIGVSANEWTRQARVAYIQGGQIQGELRKDVDITTPVYVTRYPYLKNFLDTNNIPAPRNYLTNSVLYDVNKINTDNGTGTTVQNVYRGTGTIPFIDLQRMITSYSKVPAEVRSWNQWKAIDLSTVGLKK